ncbi:hypothetical protein [Verminephrobacter aporrectodeae]|uniref:hypothetical protein n=1 Tax=Verminephrobacter aporrectodeae TaxID=1110389 RepID=UPI002238FB0D|nr:hypothetical protein [Verminephrobacter aporrectodeae]
MEIAPFEGEIVKIARDQAVARLVVDSLFGSSSLTGFHMSAREARLLPLQARPQGKSTIASASDDRVNHISLYTSPLSTDAAGDEVS